MNNFHSENENATVECPSCYTVVKISRKVTFTMHFEECVAVSHNSECRVTTIQRVL